MLRHTSIQIMLLLVGLFGDCALSGLAMDRLEIEEQVKAHINTRMYESCKAVTLTEEADGLYRGYAEFLNGMKTPIAVSVSDRMIEYTFVRPERSLPGPLQTRIKELQAVVDRQAAEIVRLRTLCHQSGINPDAARPNIEGTPPNAAPDPNAQRRVTQVERIPTGPGDTMTFNDDRYGRIQKGMTYPQVVTVLGAEGDPISASDFDNARNEVYVWANPDDSHICVVFQNGSVLVATAFGLPGAGVGPGQEIPRIERFQNWQLAQRHNGEIAMLGLSLGQWLEWTSGSLAKRTPGEPAQIDVIEATDQLIVRLARQNTDGTTYDVEFYLASLDPGSVQADLAGPAPVERICIPTGMKIGPTPYDDPAQTWQAMSALSLHSR